MVDWTALGTAAASLVAGAGGAALALRRRLSRESVDQARDRAESSFVQTLVSERDQAAALAREAFNERAGHLQTIARLEASGVHQASEIERLQLEHASFRRLVARLHPDVTQFLASSVTDLQPEQQTYAHRKVDS